MAAASSPSAPAGPSGSVRTLPDRVLGVLGAAMILAALVVTLFGGEPDGAAAPAAAEVPALELLAPPDGARVGEQLAVEFRAERELRQQPGGWGVDNLHLHLELGEVHVMPGSADLRRLPSGAYRWSLARPRPGEHSLRLYWSGADHRPIEAGASRRVTVRVE